MGCCGQGRSAPARQMTASPQKAVGIWPQANPAVATAVTSPIGTARLQFVRQENILVGGPITGRQYAFSGATPIQQVDVRDAASLLRTSWFRRV